MADATGTALEGALVAGLLPFQAIDDLIAGRVQTHIDLPERNPFVYAMRHEFLDTLTTECRHPDRFENLAFTRELMDKVMFAYATYGDLDNFSEIKSIKDFVEFYATIVTNPLSKLYPAHVIRLDLAKDPRRAVREVVAGLGGCDSQQVVRLRENLDAIAVMGPLISPDATFLKAEVNMEAGRINCFYANPDRPDYERFQPYKLATLDSVALYIVPWAAHLGPYEFFVRAACPGTPDPAFGLSETFIHPVPDLVALPQGDRAERLAALFLDQYISAYGRGPDGRPLVLAPDLKARYFDEIVKFERIAVPQDEIERVRAARKAEAGNRPSKRLDDVSIEIDLRLDLYKQQYGRGLWAVIDEIVAKSGNHSANYISARANSSYFDDVP